MRVCFKHRLQITPPRYRCPECDSFGETVFGNQAPLSKCKAKWKKLKRNTDRDRKNWTIRFRQRVDNAPTIGRKRTKINKKYNRSAEKQRYLRYG